MNEHMRRRMYAHDAAHAYLQWFGGLTFPTPEAREEARRGYEGSLRDLRGYWFGRGAGPATAYEGVGGGRTRPDAP